MHNGRRARRADLRGVPAAAAAARRAPRQGPGQAAAGRRHEAYVSIELH